MNSSPSNLTPSPAPHDAAAPIHAQPKRKRPLRERSPILAHLRANLLKGLITAIPLFITVYIIGAGYKVVTTYTEGLANWIVDKFLGPMAHLSPSALASLKTVTTPVLALLISLVIVYILGLLGTFFLGRQVLAQIDHFIGNLPLIKGIYGTTKQVMAVFRKGGGGQGFQRVILVEFPRLGTWTVAFVTNTVEDTRSGQRLVCCFIPMTPNPTSGFFQMFPEDQVRNTDWSVDMGIKIVLSGGLLAPHKIDSSAQPESQAPPLPQPPPPSDP